MTSSPNFSHVVPRLAGFSNCSPSLPRLDGTMAPEPGCRAQMKRPGLCGMYKPQEQPKASFWNEFFPLLQIILHDTELYVPPSSSYAGCRLELKKGFIRGALGVPLIRSSAGSTCRPMARRRRYRQVPWRGAIRGTDAPHLLPDSTRAGYATGRAPESRSRPTGWAAAERGLCQAQSPHRSQRPVCT